MVELWKTPRHGRRCQSRSRLRCGKLHDVTPQELVDCCRKLRRRHCKPQCRLPWRPRLGYGRADLGVLANQFIARHSAPQKGCLSCLASLAVMVGPDDNDCPGISLAGGLGNDIPGPEGTALSSWELL